MAEHSKLPWRLANKGSIEILGESSPPIVSWSGFDDSFRSEKEHKANAAFIVTACNNHKQLVLCVKDAASRMRGLIEFESCVEYYDAALAAAERTDTP